MKPSELMLKGYAMAGGKQCYGRYYNGDSGRTPTAVCAIGAMNLAASGNAGVVNYKQVDYRDAIGLWYVKFGLSISTFNDNCMQIEDIAGILASEGM